MGISVTEINLQGTTTVDIIFVEDVKLTFPIGDNKKRIILSLI